MVVQILIGAAAAGARVVAKGVEVAGKVVVKGAQAAGKVAVKAAPAIARGAVTAASTTGRATAQTTARAGGEVGGAGTLSNILVSRGTQAVKTYTARKLVENLTNKEKNAAGDEEDKQRAFANRQEVSPITRLAGARERSLPIIRNAQNAPVGSGGNTKSLPVSRSSTAGASRVPQKSGAAGEKFRPIQSTQRGGAASSALGGARQLAGKGRLPATQGKGAAGGNAAGEQALGGIAWWLLLGLMIMSDLASVICSFLVTLGLGIAGAGTASIIAAIAALPLGGGIALVGFLAGLFVTFNAYMFASGYFIFNHVPLMDAKKLATMSISAIIEMVPILSVLPMLTISFVAVTILENLKRGKGIVGGTAGKVVKQVASKAGPVGYVAGKVLTSS